MKLKNFKLSLDIYKELEVGNIAIHADHVEIYLSDVATLKVSDDVEIMRIIKLDICETAKKVALLEYTLRLLEEKTI